VDMDVGDSDGGGPRHGVTARRTSDVEARGGQPDSPDARMSGSMTGYGCPKRWWCDEAAFCIRCLSLNR
jgi:hypothetical protein